MKIQFFRFILCPILVQSIAMLVRCVSVGLMGVVALSVGTTAHGQRVLVSNIDKSSTYEIVRDIEDPCDEFLEIDCDPDVLQYDTLTAAAWVTDGPIAQLFTTGEHPNGYEVSSLDVEIRHLEKPDQGEIRVSIWSKVENRVDTLLYTFYNPVNLAVGIQNFIAPNSAILEPSTDYFVIVEVIRGSIDARVVLTLSNEEDANSLGGWNIGYGVRFVNNPRHWPLVTETQILPPDEPTDIIPALKIRINGHILDSRSIIVSLAYISEGEFKAAATASAPSDIVLPIKVINGTIEGDATTVTIPAGRTESDVISVSRTPGTTFPVTADIGNLPNPPAGYTLFKSPSRLPLQVVDGLSEGITPVCDRIPQIRDAIVAAVQGVSDCNSITEAQLSAIATLRVNYPSGMSQFRTDDFGGLTALTTLKIEGHNANALPDGVFDDLTSLKELDLYNTGLTTIPNAVLGLTSLTSLNLGYHRITSIPAGAFDQLTQLEVLILDAASPANTFTSLPDGVFDNLTSLTSLNLDQNDLTSLPDDVFDNLTSLERLSLNRIYSLSSLPAGIFDSLTSLERLSLQGLRSDSLPDGIFDNLASLTYLSMVDGRLTSLPDGIFSGLSSLTSLYLNGNSVDPLPLTVSLEKVGESQFKAVAPTGAPFDIVLPVSIRHGSISGGTNTLTIPRGSVESASLTVTRTPGTTAAVTADIGTLPGLPTDTNQRGYRLHQGYTLAKSNDLPLVVISRLASGITPVSERTQQVREAILAAVRLDDSSVSSYADITDSHLAGITALHLNGKNITTLKVGDFDGLTNLEELRLHGNQLTGLPADIFAGLTALTTLRLYGNQLSTLPEDIFDELIELRTLQLGLNQFTTLPSNIFDGLTKLTDLRMIGNQFATLPAGIFEGLTGLTTLRLDSNAVNPLPLTVSLEKVGEEQFKATAPTGAPFDIALLLSVGNGTTDSGATTLTIPAGDLESQPLTVIRTSDRTSTVTVNIGTLPGLPSNHAGYTLVKSDDLPLTFTNLGPVFTPVNERTPQVRDQIVLLTRARFQQGISANAVTPVHVRAITRLGLRNKSITSLKAGDFSGMPLLETLILDSNSIASLPESVFDGLPALKELWLQSNELTSLPTDVFDGLSALETLQLAGNSLTSLPEEVFDGLAKLATIDLFNNSITGLPEDIFDGLSGLTTLRLSHNALMELPIGVFEGLSNLTSLELSSNSLASLPGDIFDGLSSLTTLRLSSNALTSLPDGMFEGLSNLTSISMHSNSPSLFVTVSLQKAGEGRFKAIAPTGAPFDIVLPLTVTNGSISGGATTITIPAGKVEGETLTVIRTPGTTEIVTVDIGTLPGLPSGHFDYRLVKSDALPLEVSSDANEAPVFTEGSSTTRTIAENTAANVNIGTTIAATDADNDPLTYTLGGTEAASFSIVSSSGQLKTSAALDYETKSTYNVTVTVSDGNLTDTIDVTINVTDVAETLTDTGVCQVGDVLAPGESCTYPGTDTEFSILNDGRGQFLFFTSGSNLNITNTTINDVVYTLVAEKLATGSWEIEEIADSAATSTTNTAPTFTEGSSATRTVAENTAANVDIGAAIAATDADNDPLTYTLGGTDATSFDIKSTTGQLRTKAALDYETKSIYTVTITVSDGSLTDTITVTINVTDVTETSTARTAVNIPDSNLRAKIEAALGKASGDPISPSEMETLTSLTAQDASIRDLTGLETAINLTILKLGNNSISDISTLAGLTKLTELQLWDNTISDISHVAGLTNLTRFYLWGNGISDISYVSGLTNLMRLYLGENSISNISAVSGLTKLTHLYLNENALSNISAIAGLTNLTELRIGDNTISDISPVANLTKLVWLDMPNNSVTNISAVRNLTDLAALNLTNNAITDISALTNLTKLIEAFLEENSISDISPLVSNTGLGQHTEIYMQGNPLSYPSIYTHIPALQAKNVYIDFDNRVATAPMQISGDSQQGTPGTALAQPFVVEVRDANSVVFAGVPVTFTVTAGGGTLSATNTTTDANGRAQSTLTLGNTAGTNSAAASVQGISQTVTFTATAVVTTTNSAPTFTEGNSTTRTIAENTAANVSIGAAIAATDPDNDTLTYTLGGTDAASFSIVSTSGQVQTSAALDYETKSTYTVTVTVSDGSLTDTITVTINITDVVETPMETGVCQVGDVLAPGESCTYPGTDTEFSVLSDGRGQFGFFTSGSSLNLNNTTINGVVYTLVAKKLATGSWEIEEIADSATTGTTNTAPTFTDGNSTSRSVAENTTAAVNIGAAIAATDADNDTLTYTLGGTDAASFDIESTTGQLKTSAALDYETKSTYTVTVTVSDGSLTDTITVTINITDVAEMPTDTGICQVGDVLAPGESCTYPDTDATFSVLANGDARWNIPDLPPLLAWINQTSIGGSISISATVNDQAYHFVAEEVSNDSWEIKEIGDDTTEQPETPEQPEQPGDTGVTPTLTASTTTPLTETTLDESIVTLTLSGGTFEQFNSRIRNAVTVSTGITGVTVRSFDIDRVSDTEVTVELTFDGTDFDTNSTISFTVGAGAIADYDGTALTSQVSVAATTESVVASTTAPLTEATLNGSLVTLTLSGRNYDSSGVRIRNAVTVSGISGVTVGTFDIDRVSNTQITVELTFDGTDFDTNSTLTFTVGADAVANYNGSNLIAQVFVTATTEAPEDTGGQTPDPSQQPEQPGDTGITPTLTASTTTPLTETTLDESIVTLTLSGGTFEQFNSRIRNAVTVSTGITGVTVRSFDIDRVNDTEITVELTFDGTDFDTNSTVTFTVSAGAIADYNGSALTAQVPVTANAESVVASTASPLTEATLHESVVTLTLNGRSYERSSFKIRDAITISGIDGVTVSTFGVDRISDTEITIELEFNGDFDTAATLTFAVGTDAIANYSGSALTGQLPVSAGTESLTASTTTPLTEATLDESIVTLTLSGRVYESSSFSLRRAVTVSGIDGVTVSTFDVDRVSDTEVTVELTFDGTDFDTDATLTFTVEAGAIVGYNGPAFTAQIPVTASTESIVASTATPLTEATLHESVVTLTLSGRSYERSSFSIRNAVTISGIDGVTIGTFGVDRISDTEITIELEFSGNLQTDTHLILTVAADAIADYDGPAFTAELPVTAGPEADANNDGVVNVEDLVLVASNYGQTGANSADVNGDGVVNVDDVLVVTGALDNVGAGPSAHSQALELFTAANIRLWLSQAQQLNRINATSLRGILFLEQLLAALTPKETTLLPNYPNPFNPETWIPYRLAEDAFVTLTIYDSSGQVVRTLHVGHQIAAFYESRSKAIYWDGRNEFGEGLASGVYFYHLSADNFSATRRMLILK